MRVPLLPPGGPIKICPEAFTSGQIYVLKHGEAPGLVLQEGVRQGVDVLPGGLGAKADADGPGGGLFIQAHGGENVACLSPVAGGPGGNADALLPKVADDVLAGVARQGHGEDVGRVRFPDKHKALNGPQALPGVVPAGGHMADCFLQVLLAELYRLGEARDLGCRLGAGA